MKKPAQQGKVVEAVGIAARSESPGLGKLIEQAMVAAVKHCYAEGITEPDKVRAAMLEAREMVKGRHSEALARAQADMQRRAAQGADAPAPKP